PSAGSPKTNRLSIGLHDDRLAPLRTRFSQTRFRCDQEPAAKPLGPTMRDAVDSSSGVLR
ncbi:MAG: hypothetical protein ACYCV7_14545, partial [Acidimicrobiales bacterium]